MRDRRLSSLGNICLHKLFYRVTYLFLALFSILKSSKDLTIVKLEFCLKIVFVLCLRNGFRITCN